MVNQSNSTTIILADYDSSRMMDLYNRIQNANPMLKISSIANNADDAINFASTMHVDAILMEFAMLDKTAINVALELKELNDNVAVFAIADSLSADFVMAAKNKGIVEVFKRDTLAAREVADRIVEYVESRKREWETLAQEHGAIEKGTKNTKIVKEYVTKTVKQSVILTYNTKGGVGKSTVATNLAVAIKASPIFSGRKVALVDFDSAGANVCTLMQINGHESIARNLHSWETVEPQRILPDEVESLMVKGAHGVMVVPAPASLAASKTVKEEIALTIIQTLRRYFDVIVIDGSPNMSPIVENALLESDKILLIANPEGQAVKQLSRLTYEIEDMAANSERDLTYLLNRMFIVLNHAQKPSEYDMKAQDVAGNIGRPLMREIPNDDVVKRALHSSTKLPVMLEPDSPFSVAIKKLANDLVGAYPDIVGETSGRPSGAKGKKKIFGIFGK